MFNTIKLIIMEQKEISKKEYLLLQVEAMDVNKKAIVLATQHYAGREVSSYEDALAYIKKQDESSYRISSILEYYRKYESMTPAMLDKWIEHHAGLCSEPIDNGNGLPIEASVGGINVTINDTTFSIHERGVYIIQDDDASFFISKAELQYLVRAVDNIGSLLTRFR